MEIASRALVAAAVGEALTGAALVLVLAPAMVVRLLLGQEPAADAVALERVAGLALIGLGVACWPGPARTGLLVYCAAAGLYLAWLGLAGGASGVLLWPAVAVHGLLSLGLAAGHTGAR